MRFEKLLAVTHGVERRRTRADAADAQVAHPVGDAAYGGKPRQVLLKIFRVGAHGVQPRQRVGNSVLAQVVAGRHLSAKAVAAMQDGHLRRVVGRRLHQHRNVEPRQPHGVGNRALVAEVGQRHDHAIDAVAILLKQCRATLRFFVRFDRAVLAVFGTEHHAIHASLGQRLDHLFAS